MQSMHTNLTIKIYRIIQELYVLISIICKNAEDRSDPNMA